MLKQDALNDWIWVSFTQKAGANERLHKLLRRLLFTVLYSGSPFLCVLSWFLKATEGLDAYKRWDQLCKRITCALNTDFTLGLILSNLLIVVVGLLEVVEFSFRVSYNSPLKFVLYYFVHSFVRLVQYMFVFIQYKKIK